MFWETEDEMLEHRENLQLYETKDVGHPRECCGVDSSFTLQCSFSGAEESFEQRIKIKYVHIVQLNS